MDIVVPKITWSTKGRLRSGYADIMAEPHLENNEYIRVTCVANNSSINIHKTDIPPFIGLLEELLTKL